MREALVEAGRSWAGAQHRLVHLAGALAAGEDWARDGAATPAHWIADALDVEVCTAREWIRVGQALGLLPLVEAAFSSGRLSFSKVRAVTRVATAEVEAELVDLAERVPAGRIAAAVAAWRQRREPPGETERRQRRERSVTSRVEADGMVVGSFRLSPLEGGSVVAALETDAYRRVRTAERGTDATAVASGNAAERPSLARQRADSLVRLVTGRSGAGVTTEVIVHVRADGATLDDGTPIPGSVVERIAPAGFLRAMIHDAASKPIDVSGRHRRPTRRQKLVVRERDGGCVDCGSSTFLEFDHVPDFEQSKRTIVDELKPRCGRCHAERHHSGRPG